MSLMFHPLLRGQLGVTISLNKERSSLRMGSKLMLQDLNLA